MATANYRIAEKKCATCRWWGGRRMVEFRANIPFYVKVDAEAADCMAQKALAASAEGMRMKSVASPKRAAFG